MIIISFALCLSTCVGDTCGPIAANMQLDNLKAEAAEIINEAAESYDLSDFCLDNNESHMKQLLFTFMKDNQLLDQNTLSYLDNYLHNHDENYIYTSNLSEFYLKQKTIKMPRIDNTSLINTISNTQIDNTVSIKTTAKTNPLIKTMRFVDVNTSDFDDVNIESLNINEQKMPQLPIHEGFSDAWNTSMNGNFENTPFVGIHIPRDTCINFYNVVASGLNGLVINAANHVKGVAGMIVETLNTAGIYCGVSVIGIILSYFTGLWADFLSLFTSCGPIGIVVGVVISVFVAICVSVLVTMFVSGFKKKGFVVGWKVPNIFSWNWMCEWTN